MTPCARGVSHSASLTLGEVLVRLFWCSGCYSLKSWWMDSRGLRKQKHPKVFPDLSKNKTDFGGLTWCFWLLTSLFKPNKTPTWTFWSPWETTALRSPYVSSDICQKKRSFSHLCCDYWKQESSSPSSKVPHSTHSCSRHADCFHTRAGNRVATFHELSWHKWRLTSRHACRV